MKFTKPEPLADGETLSGFCCGVEVVDNWAGRWASHAKANGSAVVYVSYSADVERPVAGFYALSSHSIARERVGGGWLKRNAPAQIPVILLGMLGVDRRFQGAHLGSMLLRDAMLRSLSAAETIGAKALVVDPADESARQFYLHYGFKDIPGMNRMYIQLKLPSAFAKAQK